MSLTTTDTTTAPIWQSRDDLIPADFAALYQQAAEIIRARGYDPYDEYEAAEGISIGAALNLAAAGPVTGPRDAADLAEELETRLAAVLYVTGQLTRRTSISDLPDMVAGWERGHEHLGPRPTQAQATAVLETAAAMLTAIPADGAS